MPNRLLTILGGNTDAGTIYLDLRPSGADAGPYSDTDTAFVDLQPGGAEVSGILYTDAGTLYLDLQPETCEIFVPRSQEFVFNAEERWETDFDNRYHPVSIERWNVGLVAIGDIAECQ